MFCRQERGEMGWIMTMHRLRWSVRLLTTELLLLMHKRKLPIDSRHIATWTIYSEVVVKNLLYKGLSYHPTCLSEWNEHLCWRPIVDFCELTSVCTSVIALMSLDHYHHYLSRSCHCWPMASTSRAMHFHFEPLSAIDCHQLPRCCLSISFWVSRLLVFLLWVSILMLSWPTWCCSFWLHVLPTVLSCTTLSLLYLSPQF